MHGNAPGIFYRGMYMAFVVGTDGTLCQRLGSPPKSFLYATRAGVFDPESALSIERVNYDPANGFYDAIFVTGRAMSNPNDPVVVTFDMTNGWKIYGG